MAESGRRLTPMMKRYIAARLAGASRSEAASLAGARHPKVMAYRWETKNPAVREALKKHGGDDISRAVDGMAKKLVSSRAEAADKVTHRERTGPTLPGPETIEVTEAQGRPPLMLMSPEEIEERLAYFGRASMEDFIDIDETTYSVDEVTEDGSVVQVPRKRSFPVFNFEKAARRGQLHQIKELTLRHGFSQAVDGGTPLPWTEIKLKLHDPQTALDKLARVHDMFREGHEREMRQLLGLELWKRMLENAPDELLTEAKAHLFGGVAPKGPMNGNGASGNGHRP